MPNSFSRIKFVKIPGFVRWRWPQKRREHVNQVYTMFQDRKARLSLLVRSLNP